MNTYDSTPGPRILKVYRDTPWTILGALAELIDNSFGDLRGNAQTVYIGYNKKARILTVLDDGKGIDEVGLLFKAGSKENYSVTDIGNRGIGGSQALIWLANKAKVTSLRDGKIMQDRLIWSDWFDSQVWPKVSNQWVPATASNTPPQFAQNGVKRGTLITLHLWSMPRRSVNDVYLREDLSRMYGPGLRDGKRIIWQSVNGVKCESFPLSDPILAPKVNSKVVRLEFNLTSPEGDVLPVIGRVYFDVNTRPGDSNIDLGFGFRIIKEKVREWYRSPEGVMHSSAYISGRVSLGAGWQEYLTPLKDDIADSDLRDQLYAAVYERIRNLLKESEDTAFDIQIRGLSVGLEAALNRKDREDRDQPDIEPIEKEKRVPQLVNEPPRPYTPRPPQGKSVIAVVPQTDEELNGLLTKAEVRGTHVAVFVNKEHPLIKRAQSGAVKNTKLMNIMCINAMAIAIAADSDPCAFFRSNDYKRRIDRVSDIPTRVGIINRFLIDGIIDQSEPVSSDGEK